MDGKSDSVDLVHAPEACGVIALKVISLKACVALLRASYLAFRARELFFLRFCLAFLCLLAR